MINMRAMLVYYLPGVSLIIGRRSNPLTTDFAGALTLTGLTRAEVHPSVA